MLESQTNSYLLSLNLVKVECSVHLTHDVQRFFARRARHRERTSAHVRLLVLLSVKRSALPPLISLRLIRALVLEALRLRMPYACSSASRRRLYPRLSLLDVPTSLWRAVRTNPLAAAFPSHSCYRMIETRRKQRSLSSSGCVWTCLGLECSLRAISDALGTASDRADYLLLDGLRLVKGRRYFASRGRPFALCERCGRAT